MINYLRQTDNNSKIVFSILKDLCVFFVLFRSIFVTVICILPSDAVLEQSVSFSHTRFTFKFAWPDLYHCIGGLIRSGRLRFLAEARRGRTFDTNVQRNC